ncbi:interleukin-17 receptor A [Rhinophrynus dorsalis]
MTSNCLDDSWLFPREWTPSAPSAMVVFVGYGKNKQGRSVPLLQINWTVSVDLSIQGLQGVEVSVMQESTNQQLCVQFHFRNQFPSQVNSNRQPWQFYYSNFEVDPSQTYHVTVQNLPRQGNENSRTRSIIVPNCSERFMNETEACCRQGHCWKPQIAMDKIRNDLVVSFDSSIEYCDYRVLVHATYLPRSTDLPRDLHLENCTQRVNVTFPNLALYPVCWYKVQVWPITPACKNDCVRHSYNTDCPTSETRETPTPAPKPDGRIHLCPIAASGVILIGMLVIVCLHICIKEDPVPPKPVMEPDPIKVTRKKVWLVYSADSRRYVSVVIKLADFLRAEWGMEVVLDRFCVNEIGKIGPVTWLSKQKTEIEKHKGTILLLCSRGTQEKWKAMQNVNGPRVNLRQDNQHVLGDLFTCTLSLIFPDFQKGGHYDRYVVAYFSDLGSKDDVPLLFHMCPMFCLTHNLQDVFFRIQKKERNQPGVQFSVPQDGAPSYESLRKTVSRCRDWQDKHVDWFQKESSPLLGEESECEEEEEESFVEGVSQRVDPLIVQRDPVSMVNPLINEPGFSILVEPVIAAGPPSLQVEPNVYEGDTTMHMLEPLLVTAKAYKQEPFFGDIGTSLGHQNEHEFGSSDPSPQSDQGYLSLELLREEQMHLKQRDFGDHEVDVEALRAQQIKFFQQSDRGYMTWDSEPCEEGLDLASEQLKFLQQSGILIGLEPE